LSSYLASFCRLTLGLLFLYSFASKVRNVPRFRDAITAFRALPGPLASPAAGLVLVAELLSGVLLLTGGSALDVGYVLAAALLLLFTTVLAVALVRTPEVGCGCFGRDERPVAPADLVRNAGLLAFAAVGWWSARGAPSAPRPSPVDFVVLLLAATSLLLFWTQLAEIVELFGRGTWGRPLPDHARSAWPPGAPEPSKEMSP